MNTHIRDNERYLKGLDGVPTIQAGLTIDNSLGSERLLLPLLSTAECTTVLNAEGEVAFDETLHQMKEYDGTAVRVVLSEADVDDTPVNGATTVPVSSNWAYDFINTLTTQSDLPYATAAGVWTRLAKGTGGQYLKMNAGATAPEWVVGAVTTKIKNETRDMTAGSGDVAYTGYGFTPKGLVIFAMNAAGLSDIGSYGFGDGSLAEMCIHISSAGSVYILSTTTLIYLWQSAGNEQTAVLKTLDADGFTLTWTKTGSPTSTLSFLVFAIG